MATKLDAGDRFPAMTLTVVGGESIAIPDEIQSNYTILLFYRGHW